MTVARRALDKGKITLDPASGIATKLATDAAVTNVVNGTVKSHWAIGALAAALLLPMLAACGDGSNGTPGAAGAISVAEHPARLQLADRAALLQWAPSYRRAAAVQAPLALLAALLGLVSYFWRSAEAASGAAAGAAETQTAAAGASSWLWLLGAAASFFNIPFTLLCIMPLNQRMLAAADLCAKDRAADCPPGTRAGLLRWGRLHAARTLAGGVAVTAYVAAMA